MGENKQTIPEMDYEKSPIHYNASEAAAWAAGYDACGQGIATELLEALQAAVSYISRFSKKPDEKGTEELKKIGAVLNKATSK